MLCEMCKKKEATIHLTQVVDGAVKKVHLCEACAASSGFDVKSPMSITDILLGMGGGSDLPVGTKKSVERTCPKCHMKRADFKKTGRLGCPDCYEAFEGELAPLLKIMHRSDVHGGKIPSRESVRVQKSAELISLEKALDDAVKGEKYEEAARIRDRIRECRRVVEEHRESSEKDDQD